MMVQFIKLGNNFCQFINIKNSMILFIKIGNFLCWFITLRNYYFCHCSQLFDTICYYFSHFINIRHYDGPVYQNWELFLPVY